MKHLTKSLLCLAALAALTSSSDAAAPARSTAAFVGANVVPMDSERVLENHTVIVEDGRITAIGPANEIEVPAGAEVIDAHETYLIPGLADMHTHLWGTTEPFSGADQLDHYLAAGVTTIRSLSGSERTLELREEVAAGKRLGPTIYTSGRTIVGLPSFLSLERYKFAALVALSLVLAGLALWIATGIALRRRRGKSAWTRVKRYRLPSLAALAIVGAALVMTKVIPIDLFTSRTLYSWAHVVDTPDQARASVREQAEAGYDVIKIYDYLSPEATLAALDEASKRGIYAVGHLNDDMPLQTLLDAGLAEVVHIDELMTYHMLGKTSAHGKWQPVKFDYDRIPETVAALRDSGAFVVSNLVADEVSYQLIADPEGLLERPEYASVSDDVRHTWTTEGRAVAWKGQEQWRRDTMVPFLKVLLHELHRAGVPLLVGTDVSVEGMMPSHLHRDLELLVESGLSPYQALEAGTKNAGLSVARMGRDGSFGTIEVGQRADLLLLSDNPLENISNTRGLRGVMVHGHWLPKDRPATIAGASL